MRSYAENLKKNKFKIEYSKIDSQEFKKKYTEKLMRIISRKKIKKYQALRSKINFLKLN